MFTGITVLVPESRVSPFFVLLSFYCYRSANYIYWVESHFNPAAARLDGLVKMSHIRPFVSDTKWIVTNTIIYTNNNRCTKIRFNLINDDEDWLILNVVCICFVAIFSFKWFWCIDAMLWLVIIFVGILTFPVELCQSKVDS